jgi:hypothetical protein
MIEDMSFILESKENLEMSTSSSSYQNDSRGSLENLHVNNRKGSFGVGVDHNMYKR